MIAPKVLVRFLLQLSPLYGPYSWDRCMGELFVKLEIIFICFNITLQYDRFLVIKRFDYSVTFHLINRKWTKYILHILG